MDYPCCTTHVAPERRSTASFEAKAACRSDGASDINAELHKIPAGALLRAC